jgi:preprotein translocase subunit SecY
MINILARLPQSIFMEWENLVSGIRPWPIEIIVIAFLCFIIWSIIIMTQGIRKIPVQYAKRQVGRKVYGGQTQHIPLRINTAGVMPIIFAQSLMFIPGTLASFFPNSPFFNVVARMFDHRSAVYALVYSFIIIFFTYFYTAIVFSPREIADNMKKQGGFIPGIRPGSHTAEYIDKILSRITLPGSVYLALIAIMPTLVSGFFGVDIALASFFGGTSLLIMVGVILDLLSQIESHLMMRHYDGFMKSGRIKGRVSI